MFDMLSGSLSFGLECLCIFSSSIAVDDECGCWTLVYVGKLMGSAVLDWMARRNFLGFMNPKFPLLFG